MAMQQTVALVQQGQKKGRRLRSSQAQLLDDGEEAAGLVRRPRLDLVLQQVQQRGQRHGGADRHALLRRVQLPHKQRMVNVHGMDIGDDAVCPV